MQTHTEGETQSAKRYSQAILSFNSVYPSQLFTTLSKIKLNTDISVTKMLSLAYWVSVSIQPKGGHFSRSIDL